MKKVYRIKIMSRKGQGLEFKFHDARIILTTKITQGHYRKRMLQINLSHKL